MDYAKMTMPKLRALARELGLMPSKGSGSGGRVIKKDLLSVLAGAPETVAEIQATRGDPAKRYAMDLEYEVVQSFGGYESGDSVMNYPRILGQELLEQGKIKPKRGGFQGSNPKGIVRRPHEDR